MWLRSGLIDSDHAFFHVLTEIVRYTVRGCATRTMSHVLLTATMPIVSFASVHLQLRISEVQLKPLCWPCSSVHDRSCDDFLRIYLEDMECQLLVGVKHDANLKQRDDIANIHQEFECVKMMTSSLSARGCRIPAKRSP
jgi:hypothetical protein